MTLGAAKDVPAVTVEDEVPEYASGIHVSLGRSRTAPSGSSRSHSSVGSVYPASSNGSLGHIVGKPRPVFEQARGLELFEMLRMRDSRWKPAQKQPVIAVRPPSLGFSFVLLGFGALAPWSVFLSTYDLYLSASSSGFDVLLGLLYMLSVCSTSAYFVAFPRSHSRYLWDISVGFLFLACITVFVPLLPPQTPGTTWTSNHVWALYVSFVLLGFVNAFMQSSMFAAAALFPHGECTKAVNTGGSFGGVVFVLLRMAALLETRLITRARSSDAAPDVDTVLVESRFTTYLSLFCCVSLCLFCALQTGVVSRSPTWLSAMNDVEPGSGESRKRVSLKERFEEAKSVLHFISEPFLAVWVSNAITFTLLFAMFCWVRNAQAADVDERQAQLWFSTMVIGVYSCGDWLGKDATFDTFGLTSRRAVLLAAYVRLAFLPIAIVSAFRPENITTLLTITVLFGGTNGLVTGASFVLAPNLVGFHDKDKAGRSMVLAMVLGVATGGVLGLFLFSCYYVLKSVI